MALSPHLLRVLNYLDDQLAAEHKTLAPTVISIEQLSQIAHWSKFHFQRQFFCQCGLSVQSYLRLLRLLRAASQLTFRQIPLTDIAALGGYQHSESFSRAFRRLMQQTPVDFRTDPDWQQWQNQLQQLAQVRSFMQQHQSNVDIIDFPATPIALFMHQGSPALLGDSIRQFIEFRKANRLPPSSNATFNLLYDDPRQTAPQDYRFGLATALPATMLEKNLTINNAAISLSEIPAGRCARLQHTGDDQQLAALVDDLYQHWLPQSGEQPADFPIFLQRKVFFPDVPAHLAQTDILMLLKNDSE